MFDEASQRGRSQTAAEEVPSAGKGHSTPQQAFVGRTLHQESGASRPQPPEAKRQEPTAHRGEGGVAAGWEPSRQGKASTQRQSSRELDAEMKS